MRSYAHFEPGISVIKGLHNNFGPNFSVLGDHWSPILAALAPLYWIFNGPQTLLVAQAVLFALAVPPLWLFTRRTFCGGRKATIAAYLVSVAYALSWPIASAAAFDVHEVAFAPVLTAVALERLSAGRLRTALVALAALLLVKEDMGLFAAGIGVYLAVARPKIVPRQRLVALALVVFGVADTWVATYLLIPAFGGRSDYYWAYGALGHNVPQVLEHIVTHPVGAVRMFVTPRVKLDTMLWLLAPFCFLPLLSPLTIAVIPLLAERMLQNQFPNWWLTTYHYNAYLVIILAFGAVDGAARLDRWVTRARRHRALAQTAEGVEAVETTQIPAQADRGAGTVALVAAAAICIVSVCLVPRFALGAALHPSFYHRNAEETTAAAAVAAVPAGVTVEAVNRLGPHLPGGIPSCSGTVTAGPRYTRPGWSPPWPRRQFTFRSVTQQEQRLALLRQHGYQAVFEPWRIHRAAQSRRGHTRPGPRRTPG